ncbi:hypothetical protein D9613_009056 [Agrocybe pediades]|uniref:Uncharacterized protein n=1 Tax=Agrocybe pediades TaxID=84607 RepID=A0A8H4R502_9AGAR|nr:hypothetical protein D9613_009056 [Agrocybe pediades]
MLQCHAASYARSMPFCVQLNVGDAAHSHIRLPGAQINIPIPDAVDNVRFIGFIPGRLVYATKARPC